MSVAIAGLLLLAPAAGIPASPPIALAHADGRLLERVLSESRVERVADRPRLAEYSEAWLEAFGRWLHRLIGKHAAFWETASSILQVLAWVIVAAAALLLLAVLVRVLARRSRSAAAAPAAEDRTRSAELTRDAAAWRAELERRIAGGEIEAALEALWWWFARSIAREVDITWTSRQLLLAARRADLAPAALDLDKAMYGPRRPHAEELSGLLLRLEGAIT